MDGQATVEAWPKPWWRTTLPPRQHNTARRIQLPMLDCLEHGDCPIGVGDSIVVDKKNEVAVRRRHRSITRVAGAHPRLDDVTHWNRCMARKLFDNITGLIGRIVIDDQAFRLDP